MQILSVTSQKGGVGKTTITMNLAIAAASTGVPTVVFDLDPQASAMSWYDRRLANENPDQPKVVSIQPARLPHELKNAISDGYQLAIIDTPPNVSGNAIHIAAAGDVVLIPVQPSIVDLDAVQVSIEIAKGTGRPAAIVLNTCPPRRFSGGANKEAAVTEEARRTIEEDLDFPVVPQTICNRADYKNSAVAGLGVIEWDPEGKAADELMSLWDWVKDALDQVKASETKEAVNG